MSFATDVKKEIISAGLTSDCCLHAMCYGFMLFSRGFSAFDISVLTDCAEAAEEYCRLSERVCGVNPVLIKSESGKSRAEVATAEERLKILNTFGYDEHSKTTRMNWGNIADECCKAAFLRGVFLACGTVNNPSKRYHMEFVVPFLNLSRDLMKFITDFDEFQIEPKYIKRNACHIIYFKDSEYIEELLTAMGAVNSCLELMGVKMYKDMRNNVNRKLNFESANLDKTIDASSRQISAINHIKATVGLSYLSEELREIAEIRLENPDMSLRELGESMTKPISRSGVNHRLQKLCQIAETV